MSSKSCEKTDQISCKKSELLEKLHQKLRSKQTSRLSRTVRERMIDNLEKQIENKNIKGKDLLKLKKRLHELEEIDEREYENEINRSIPNLEY